MQQKEQGSSYGGGYGSSSYGTGSAGTGSAEIMAVTVALAVLVVLEALADMGIQAVRSLLPEPGGQRRMCGCRQQKIICNHAYDEAPMCFQSFRTVTPAGII